jgi:polysaccharide export outer membrane protein
VVAKAPDTPGDVQASASVDEEASGRSKDYRLAPGDRLNILVYDQPQLSGEFIIDGGGGILLPLAGAVSLSGLTLAEAQQLIQERFADGVLVQPAVSVRITDYRPIFVTGNVRKPGSYPFTISQSVKAAIAAAGGEGVPIEGSISAIAAMSEFITAEQRVRQLEGDRAYLLMRKARLQAQRDGHENFVAAMPVSLGSHSADFGPAYSDENDTLSRLVNAYHEQLGTLQTQRPRVEAEVKAVIDQIARQNERLAIVNSRLADLEGLFSKGLLRKEVLQNQQIEKSLVEGQISNLNAQVARLRYSMGDLDVKLGDLKTAYLRQALADLQSTSERLREVEINLAPARRLLAVKAQGAGSDDAEYTIRITRIRDGALITFDATEETILSPGDVVEVKPKRHVSDNEPGLSTEAIRELLPASSLAQGIESISN